MTGLHEYEAWLDELDKKLCCKSDGILSMFGPNEYFVGFNNLKNENEIIRETLKFSLTQIDYLPNVNYLGRRFMSLAYGKIGMSDKAYFSQEAYRRHSIMDITSSLTNQIYVSDSGTYIEVGSKLEKPGFRVAKCTNTLGYDFEILKSGCRGKVINKTTVAWFEILKSDKNIVLTLPSETVWNYIEDGVNKLEKTEEFYRVSINTDNLRIDSDFFYNRLQHIKSS